MATKAAKSITINATKYELANALGTDNGKIQLKAKDVVLDEVTPPSTESYVRFVADGTQNENGVIPATAITIEKSADITNMTWAQFVEKVRTGTKVSLKIITQHASLDKAYIVDNPVIIDGIVNFDENCVKFQFTGINRADGYWTPLIYTGTKSFYYNYFWRVSRASVIDWDNFSDDEERPFLYLSEVEVPAGIKYVVFDFGIQGVGFESCKDQDGNDVLTAADVKNIVLAGGDIYVMSWDNDAHGVRQNYWWKGTAFTHWIAANEVKFEALFPHSVNFWHKLTATGTFADNPPTLSGIS